MQYILYLPTAKEEVPDAFDRNLIEKFDRSK